MKTINLKKLFVFNRAGTFSYYLAIIKLNALICHSGGFQSRAILSRLIFNPASWHPPAAFDLKGNNYVFSPKPC
jgi:hypothetical protein